MSKIILEISTHGNGDGHVTHHTLESGTYTLGRGYDSDIILTDPHVSAHHLKISFDGEKWNAEDAASENGVFINGKPLAPKGMATISSGDTIEIGRMEIRAFAPDTAIAPTVRMQKAHPLFTLLSRPKSAFAIQAIGIGLICFFAYATIWSDQPSAAIGGALGAACIAMVIWAGIWSIAGRLIKHKGNFNAHLSLASLFLAFSILTAFVIDYLNFLSNDSDFIFALDNASSYVLTAALIYGALALATEAPKRKRLNLAIRYSMLLFLGAAGLFYASMDDFDSAPPFSSTLEPYLSSLASATDVDGFIKESDKLFSSDTFKGK